MFLYESFAILTKSFLSTCSPVEIVSDNVVLINNQNIPVYSKFLTNLEEIIDSYIKKIDKMDAFIVPGTSLISANLHIARTICRKSERRICTLSKVENVNPLLLKYINRLSDVLYAIARFNESELIYIKY